MSEERLNSAKERLESEKSRKERVKQAQNYHKQQKKAEKLKKDKICGICVLIPWGKCINIYCMNQ